MKCCDSIHQKDEPDAIATVGKYRCFLVHGRMFINIDQTLLQSEPNAAGTIEESTVT
jgi:hypothetical protein